MLAHNMQKPFEIAGKKLASTRPTCILIGIQPILSLPKQGALRKEEPLSTLLFGNDPGARCDVACVAPLGLRFGQHK